MGAHANAPVVVTSNYDAEGFEESIHFDSSLGAIVFTLPPKTANIIAGREIDLIDVGEVSVINNITIQTSDGTTTDLTTIATNGRAVTLKLFSDDVWRVDSDTNYSPATIGTISTYTELTIDANTVGWQLNNGNGQVIDIRTDAINSNFVPAGSGLVSTNVEDALKELALLRQILTISETAPGSGVFVTNTGLSWTSATATGTEGNCEHPPYCLKGSAAILVTQYGTQNQMGVVELILSKQPNNCAQVLEDGLWVPCSTASGAITVDDTSTLDLTLASDVITGTVIISTEPNNVVTDNNGIFVDGSLLHDPVTVTDTPSIDLTLTSQNIQADLLLDPASDNEATITSNGLLVRGGTKVIINQPGHGFVLPAYGFIPVHNNAGTFVLATSASEIVTKDLFITEIIDVNNFVVRQNGFITVGGHGLTVGQYYYLDNAGAITTTVPTTGMKSVMCHVVTDSIIMLVDNLDVNLGP